METLVKVIGIFLGLIVIFVLFREIITWYFKLNKIVTILDRIEENTRPKNTVREPLESSSDLV